LRSCSISRSLCTLSCATLKLRIRTGAEARSRTNGLTERGKFHAGEHGKPVRDRPD
jgi:hypothetical protein